MSELDILQAIDDGVAYPQDRSISPAKCKFLPRSNKDLKTLANITYADIDRLDKAGLITLAHHDGYTCAVFNYEGRKRYLELNGWKGDEWRQRFKQYVCCDKAIYGGHCVCVVKVDCLEHGIIHYGSHD